MSKIFGIGLPRTGTASLSESLDILGFNTRHYPKFVSRASKFDALVDTPICNYFEYLDEEYSGSKFILTIRDLKPWLKSCENASRRFRWHKLSPDGRCGEEVYKSHIDLFGTIGFDENKFIYGYFQHTLRVLEYFKNRKDDLLIYEVSEGWEPLCKFLNKNVPGCSFPHRNKSKKQLT